MKKEEDNKVEVLKPIDAKVVKYFKARQQGKSKSDASLLAGYADTKHASRIEKTQAYQNVAQAFRNALLETMPLNEIAQLTARNARQTRDVGGSNGALKLALDKITEEFGNEEDDMVVMLLSEDKEKKEYRLK